MNLKIPVGEYSTRAKQLLEYVKQQEWYGVALFDNFHITYLTGFAFIPTERPICFAMNADGERVLFVPRLEVEHANAEAQVDRVESYLEYPGNPHPMIKFAEICARMNIRIKVGADYDGYPWILGYQGSALSALLGAQVMDAASFVEKLMMVKSDAELTLIRESCKWANLAHRLLFKYTRVGAHEVEVSQRASNEATLAMLDTLGALYRSQSMWSSGPTAGYRGQIGRNASIPHTLTTNATFLPGDVLVSEAGCPMWGYQSELERTMIVGEANVEQKTFFEWMLGAQQTALDAMRPGVKCSEVDAAVRAYYEKNNLMPYWRHHSGHAIGLRYHEGPFLDAGDDTVLEPGMVFTVEPGLYAPNLGGFRHSDTVAITRDSIETMTYYPRDLASLTISAQ
ncbi:MAG: aminopeptidase P family protein [Chloroflexi bacterium]|nr:aminopeptidase P family protein [Chloroflexota bacterium]